MLKTSLIVHRHKNFYILGNIFYIRNYLIIDVFLPFRKAIKAVGVLFVFLGFSNFVFFINPKDGSTWEDAYYVINAVLQSSQVHEISYVQKC